MRLRALRALAVVYGIPHPSHRAYRSVCHRHHRHVTSRVVRRSRPSIARVASANRPRLVTGQRDVAALAENAPKFTPSSSVIQCVRPGRDQARLENETRVASLANLSRTLPSLRGPHVSARDRAGWSVEAPLATMAERFGFETGKLVMSQFRSRTRIGRKKRLLEEAEKILRSGAVEQPKWFNALKTCVARPKVSLDVTDTRA